MSYGYEENVTRVSHGQEEFVTQVKDSTTEGRFGHNGYIMPMCRFRQVLYNKHIIREPTGVNGT